MPYYVFSAICIEFYFCLNKLPNQIIPSKTLFVETVYHYGATNSTSDRGKNINIYIFFNIAANLKGFT